MEAAIRVPVVKSIFGSYGNIAFDGYRSFVEIKPQNCKIHRQF